MSNNNIVELCNQGTINKNTVHIITPRLELALHFSYSTLVGFTARVTKNDMSSQRETWTSLNEWGNTTGKFINRLEPDKSKRIPHDELMRKFSDVMTNNPYYPLPSLI